MAVTPTPGKPRPIQSSRRFVRLAFTFVALGALAATSFAVIEARRLEAEARAVASNTLTSIRLAGQLENRIEKQRILIDDHIFAKGRVETAELDRQLLDVDADVTARLAEFERWLFLPGEHEIWTHMRGELEALRAPVAEALALSRVNRDVEAKVMMDRVAGQFAAVEKDIDDLIAINDRGAAASVTELTKIRQRLVVTLVGIGLASLIVIAIVGRWSLQQIARHEREMWTHAEWLETQNRELDAFAGRVAHDIRGGLTTITLAMTPLEKRLPKDDSALAILRRGTKRMEALVEDLLTLARVEAEARGRCDPAAVVAQVAQELAPRLEAAHGALRVSVSPGTVACSEGLLRQAVVNLIDNAVKYQRPEVPPEIEVAGAPVDGSYDLRVSDNGVGIAAEEARRVGEPFYRASRTRGVPGTGLGLSIVNRVVEASGGTLSLRSQVGEGSSFLLHLPLAREDSTAASPGGARRA
ncbi:MAG TPA: ATP-binding protein [Polyangia bacterium]|jgi:signal transduction histidine kinase|nr:ATP-binding protein [Polyangia bacterium]